LLAPIILAPSVRVLETQPRGEGGTDWGYQLGNPTRMVGSNSEIELPEEIEGLDVEARIALVVSGRGQYVRPEEAHEFILGYAPTLFFKLPEEAEHTAAHGLPVGAANDVFWALGPVLTTPDELIDNLGESLTDYSWQYRLRLNGETLSEAETLQLRSRNPPRPVRRGHGVGVTLRAAHAGRSLCRPRPRSRTRRRPIRAGGRHHRA